MTTRFPTLHLESATRGPHKHIRRLFNYNIFFSRRTGRFRTDLTDYVRKSAILALSAAKEPQSATIVLNFCTTPNWYDLVEALVDSGVSPTTTHDLSGPIARPNRSISTGLFLWHFSDCHRLLSSLSITLRNYRGIKLGLGEDWSLT
jgi:hypothetical protein